MKKINTIRKFKEDLISYLAMIIIILSWGGLGIYILIISFKDIYLNSFEGWFNLLFRSQIFISILLLSIPLFFLYYYIKELFFPTKYIGRLMNIKNTEYDKKFLYKLNFKMNLKSTNKNTEILEDNMECVVKEIWDLSKNKDYLLTLTLNNRIKNICEYDKEYKTISNKNIALNMDIVFALTYFLIGYPIIGCVANIIYDAITYKQFINSHTPTYILATTFLSLVIILVIKTHTNYNKSTKEKPLEVNEKSSNEE